MPACPSPPPEPFTWGAYGRLLDLALAAGYAFTTFDRLGEPGPGRRLWLRHDIDYDLAAVGPVADIEARCGARATYFFQTHCLFYDVGTAEGRRVVRDVLARGHALGLHFDATQVPGDADVLAGVESAASWLEDTFGQRVAAVSFHMPTHRPVRHLVLRGGRVNTYAPLFFDRVAYVSDSNQDWRGKDLEDVLANQRPPALQVLTHPEWWRARFTPMLTILHELAARLGLDVERDILTPEQRVRLGRAA